MENTRNTTASHSSRSRKPTGQLLLLGCSGRKRSQTGRIPAIELYDGVNFRVLRSFLHRRGWPPGLLVKILSAKYGLIDAADLIESYDQLIDYHTARQSNPEILKTLAGIGRPASVFVNLGKTYLVAVEGIDDLFPPRRIIYARGGIGRKMKQMKQWLYTLRGETVSLPGVHSRRSYLYFFPDWDDYVHEPFVHETANDEAPSSRKTRKYAHQVFGARETPYDGMLVSLAQIYTTKGALSRLDPATSNRKHLREAMNMHKRLLLFGDCGAFSYVSEEEPPFSPAEAARLYHCFGFDLGASVDHIPLREIRIGGSNGGVTKRVLTCEERRFRMELTTRNAEEFLALRRRHRYRFVPLGVVQGIDVSTYLRGVQDYIDMGYRHIALGGLVPRSDSAIVEICSAVRSAIQDRTRTLRKNIWLHLFGVLRPKIQDTFRLLGVSSFDSASYLRKAWLRSDQNYLAPDGRRWYGAIRVPLSTSKKLQSAADGQSISLEQLRELEQRCLVALRDFDGSEEANRRVMQAVNAYGPLLQRRGEGNHFVEKYERVLSDQPWARCRCPICRDIGIDVVVFRGSGRNKRRGFHNTWVLYNKILNDRRMGKGRKDG